MHKDKKNNIQKYEHNSDGRYDISYVWQSPSKNSVGDKD